MSFGFRKDMTFENTLRENNANPPEMHKLA